MKIPLDSFIISSIIEALNISLFLKKTNFVKNKPSST